MDCGINHHLSRAARAASSSASGKLHNPTDYLSRGVLKYAPTAAARKKSTFSQSTTLSLKRIAE
jgi:hypothetical protein